MNRNGIAIFPATNLCDREVADPEFPSRLTCWDFEHSLDLRPEQSSHPPALQLSASGTHFGYVASGVVTISLPAGIFSLCRGMYFSIPGAAQLSGHSSGFLATRVGYRGFFQIGGPVEEQGRLRYIDGCSDSLLIPPIVLGDPCLNLLYLPPCTEQTEHTHPSCRLGMIASGSGICRSPQEDYPLTVGMVFNIEPGALHSFHTAAKPLTVIAWHPDSDFGPAHQNHPMINRTMIEGVSAADRAYGKPVQGISE